jgi:hypothetical protein
MYKVGASLIPTVFALAFWASAATASTPPCPVAANLAVVKGSYLAGEPIELRLTASNAGSETVRIAAAYPTFEAGDDSGLRFTAVDGRHDTRRSERAEAQPVIPSLTVPMLPLAPGETWSVSVFLQRFMPDLGLAAK